MRMPILESERLMIRPFTMDDLEACQQILDIDLKMEPRSLEARKQWLQWTVMNYEELARLDQPPYGDRAVVLKHTHQLIGACGLVPCLAPFGLLPSFRSPTAPSADRLYSAEVGLFYAFFRAHWGQGYATEATEALIAYAFTKLHLRRIVATTAYASVHSIGVMQRVGMRIDKNPTAFKLIPRYYTLGRWASLSIRLALLQGVEGSCKLDMGLTTLDNPPSPRRLSIHQCIKHYR